MERIVFYFPALIKTLHQSIAQNTWTKNTAEHCILPLGHMYGPTLKFNRVQRGAVVLIQRASYLVESEEYRSKIHRVHRLAEPIMWLVLLVEEQQSTTFEINKNDASQQAHQALAQLRAVQRLL